MANVKHASAKNPSAPVAEKAVPVAAESGKEGKAGRREKRAKRVPWGERDEKGRLKTKLKDKNVQGFDPKIHLPLRKGDFENPSDAMELQADRLEAKAIALRKRAVEDRQLGNVQDRQKARKMKNLLERFKKYEKEFKESGMSDDEIAAFLQD